VALSATELAVFLRNLPSSGILEARKQTLSKRRHRQLADGTDAPGRTLDVAVFIDEEDIFSRPEVGNDESVKELATILSEEGLKATFLVVADRAQLLQDRGRKDVIESIARHEVGSHMLSVSHPTGPEYVAGKNWQEAVELSLRQEKEGVETISRVFGKRCSALSMHRLFATPHAIRAGGMLGLPYVYAIPAAPPLYSLSWYAGALAIPWGSPTVGGASFRAFFTMDDAYSDMDAFEKQLRRLDQHIDLCLEVDQPFLTIMAAHPQRIRLIDYVDPFWAPNGVNYPNERWGMHGRPRMRSARQVDIALANFRRFAKWIRHERRLNPMTIAEVAKLYGDQPTTIKREELVEAALAISQANEVLLHPRFSPAEITSAIARELLAFEEQRQLPPEIPRDCVLGPTSSPIYYPEAQGCTHRGLIALAQRLVDHMANTGCLPATLGEPFNRVGVNHLYRALAESLLAIHSGSVREQIDFVPLPPWPSLALQIGLAYVEAQEAGLVLPDLDVNTVYRDAKLQTWSLKAAIIHCDQ